MTQKDLTRAEIIAKGKVQKVTYRDAVDDIAVGLNVVGFVENLKPRDVRIIAEGKEKNIKEFIKRIRIKRFPINVKELDVEFKSPTGEFEYFEIKRGDPDEELGERLDVAGTLLYRSMALQEGSLKKLAKLDDMNLKLEKIVENTEEIKANTSKYEVMHEEITRLKEDMSHVKEALALV